MSFCKRRVLAHEAFASFHQPFDPARTLVFVGAHTFSESVLAGRWFLTKAPASGAYGTARSGSGGAYR